MSKYSHVYTFFGADSKVGTTMIVTSIAEKLAEKNKILVIHANKKPSINYIKEVDPGFRGIDELQNKLMSNVLAFDDIEYQLIKGKGFDVIAGVKELEKCRHFRVEDMDKILKNVIDRYDTVLIDAGCDYEYNALAIGALNYSEHTVLVTTQQEVVRAEMERVTNLSDKMKIKFGELLVNKLQPSGVAVIEVEELHKVTRVENLLGTIRNSAYSWQGESDHETLSGIDKEFNRDIQELAKSIAERLSINEPIETGNSKGFKGFKGLFSK